MLLTPKTICLAIYNSVHAKDKLYQLILLIGASSEFPTSIYLSKLHLFLIDFNIPFKVSLALD